MSFLWVIKSKACFSSQLQHVTWPKKCAHFLIHNTASSKTLTHFYVLPTVGKFHWIFDWNLPSVDVAVSIDCVHHDNTIFLHNSAVPGIDVLIAQGYNGWGKKWPYSQPQTISKKGMYVSCWCAVYLCHWKWNPPRDPGWYLQSANEQKSLIHGWRLNDKPMVMPSWSMARRHI